jgi:antitoxin component of MazEF toxin-antitoxin module
VTIEEGNESAISLEELLANITDENIHRTVDWGPAVGKEIW